MMCVRVPWEYGESRKGGVPRERYCRVALTGSAMERGRSILCRSAPGGAETNLDETRAPNRIGAAKTMRTQQPREESKCLDASSSGLLRRS
jgi:hypothetical protein